MRKIDQLKLAILALDQNERALLKAWIVTLEDERHHEVSSSAPPSAKPVTGGCTGRGRRKQTSDPVPRVRRNKN